MYGVFQHSAGLTILCVDRRAALDRTLHPMAPRRPIKSGTAGEAADHEVDRRTGCRCPRRRPGIRFAAGGDPPPLPFPVDGRYGARIRSAGTSGRFSLFDGLETPGSRSSGPALERGRRSCRCRPARSIGRPPLPTDGRRSNSNSTARRNWEPHRAEQSFDRHAIALHVRHGVVAGHRDPLLHDVGNADRFLISLHAANLGRHLLDPLLLDHAAGLVGHPADLLLGDHPRDLHRHLPLDPLDNGPADRVGDLPHHLLLHDAAGLVRHFADDLLGADSW